MTPKEKAEELVNKYFDTIMSFLTDNMKKMNAKKCALIAVDEVLTYSKAHGFIGLTEYYEEVKQEIEKL